MHPCPTIDIASILVAVVGATLVEGRDGNSEAPSSVGVERLEGAARLRLERPIARNVHLEYTFFNKIVYSRCTFFRHGLPRRLK